MTETSTATDYSLKHEFLGSLEGADGQQQLSEEQVKRDSTTTFFFQIFLSFVKDTIIIITISLIMIR